MNNSIIYKFFKDFTNHRKKISVPAYVRKKVLIPGRNIESTRARMMGKSPGVQFGMRFSTWNVGSILGKWDKISETLGIIVANWLIGKIVGGERYSDKVMKVIIIGDVV